MKHSTHVTTDELWNFTREAILMTGGDTALATLEALAKALGVPELDVIRHFFDRSRSHYKNYQALVAAHQLGADQATLRELFRAR